VNDDEQTSTVPADYTTRVSPFVERFAADMTEAGMQRMASRVFACLLASDEGALSSAELADRLQVSPAAISGAVRYLAQVHMVSREREPGSRRERYRVHVDVWYEALADRDSTLVRWSHTLRAGAKALGPDTPAGRRLAETEEFFDFVKGELADLLERWRVHRDRLRAAAEAEAADAADDS
jgi:DNA-binding transcriptional regulator GbsR (MarR family)